MGKVQTNSSGKRIFFEGPPVKVTLDLSKLLHDGTITAAEFDRLARLGKRETGMLLVNVLVGFGVVAVAGGIVALLPTVVTGAVLGLMLMAVGAGLVVTRREQWSILASICVLVAALLLASSILLFSQGMFWMLEEEPPKPLFGFPYALALVALLFAASSVLAYSALLASLSVLALFVLLGSGTSYAHAFYELNVSQPALTVVAMSALAWGAHLWSGRVAPPWERLLVIAARTALFLVNLGFWVGSLWGDELDWLRNPGFTIPRVAFGMAWAAALVGAGVWAGQTNRRWVLNLVAVFGGIHFYTQWFERLGATPGSVLAAGVLMLVFAVGLWRLNRVPPGLLPGAARS